MLAIATQAHLELHLEHAAMQLDVANAFSTCARRKMFDELLEHPELRELVPLAFATLSPASIMVGLDAGDLSDEGGQQGDPLICLLFCLAIHPDLKWADTELKRSGGCAKAEMDDIVLLGPPAEVLRVAAALKVRLKRSCDLTLNKSKSKVTGRNMDDIRGFLADERYSEFAIGCTKSADPATVQYGEGIGLRIHGVPVGDTVYTHEHLNKVATAAGATITKIDLKLRDSSAQAVQAFTIYVFQTLLQHLSQTITPEIMAPYLKRLDDAIADCSSLATGIDHRKTDSITSTRMLRSASPNACTAER